MYSENDVKTAKKLNRLYDEVYTLTTETKKLNIIKKIHTKKENKGDILNEF